MTVKNGIEGRAVHSAHIETINGHDLVTNGYARSRGRGLHVTDPLMKFVGSHANPKTSRGRGRLHHHNYERLSRNLLTCRPVSGSARREAIDVTRISITCN